MSLRKYLHEINGSIQIHNPGIPSTMRDHDEHIMDIALNMEKFKPGQLRRINYCRLYLNVTTLADITNANGDTIDTAAFEGNRASMQAPSLWQGIHQQKPDRTSWALWKKVLRQVSYTSNRQHRLIQPLGQWTITMENMRRAWSYWHDPLNQRLYSRTKTEIREHMRLWYDYDIDEYQVIPQMPQSAIPVDVEDNGVTWRVNPHHNTWALRPTPRPSNEIHDSIQQMDEWEKQLLQGMEILVDLETLVQQITQPVIFASDGSVQEHRASYGWVMAITDGTRLAQCTGPAYGYRPTSFRAEGYGLLSVIRFIHLIQTKWNTSGRYTILCDNEAMIGIMQDHVRVADTYPNQTLKSEWDIIAETKATIDTDKLWEAIEFRHIKGHADQRAPYNSLTLSQQLNVEADKLANEYIQRHHDDEYNKVPLLPTSGAQLNMFGSTITY
jgi:hypothetical protein